MTIEPRIPTPEGLNAEFYARSIEAGKLTFQRCVDCGRFRHPPRLRCDNCRSDVVEWVSLSGRGELFSWTVTHAPFDRRWRDALPYITVVVELDEGVRVVGALADLPADELRLGLALEASLEPHEDQFVFVTFRPVG